MESKFLVVLVTAKDSIQAEKIAQELLTQRLAACVNIVKDVHSLFWWEGRVDRSPEVLLVIKSRGDVFKRLVKAVKSVHSYSVPEIIALPIVDGSPDYLKWVNESVKK